jgi:hypothetical protein
MVKRARLALLALLAACAGRLPEAKYVTVDGELQALQERFDASSRRPRLLLLLSPS